MSIQTLQQALQKQVAGVNMVNSSGVLGAEAQIRFVEARHLVLVGDRYKCLTEFLSIRMAHLMLVDK